MRFILLAIGAMALALVPGAANNDDYMLEDGTLCPLIGTATSDAGKDLNRHKNRAAAPTDDQIDSEVSLAAMLAPGNDINRFDQEKGTRIRAFVVDVKPGGRKETCNCKADTAVDMDTHIEIGLAAGVDPTERVIVEVTPRVRKLMKQQGENWSTTALRTKLKGQWVEFTGWLLFDTMHLDGAENTNPGGDKNWRATCWEIHPVTAIKVLRGAPPAVAAVRPDAVMALRRAHTAHVQAAPNARAAIEVRNATYLKKFDPSELEEKEAEAKERRP